MRIPITSRRCHEPGFDWADWVWRQVVLPVNGDPFIGMLETPVTSAPVVAGFLSNLPAYRTGVSPLLRGVEVGLAHGLLVRPLPCPLLPPPTQSLIHTQAIRSRHRHRHRHTGHLSSTQLHTHSF